MGPDGEGPRGIFVMILDGDLENTSLGEALPFFLSLLPFLRQWW